MRCSNAALHSARAISTSKLEFRVRDRNRQLMGENQTNAINKSQQSFLLPHSHTVSERKLMPGGLDEPRNAMNRKTGGTQTRAFSRKEKSLAPAGIRPESPAGSLPAIPTELSPPMAALSQFRILLALPSIFSLPLVFFCQKNSLLIQISSSTNLPFYF